MQSAGLQVVSFTKQLHQGTITLAKLHKAWDQITPFVFPVVDEALRQELHHVYMEHAVRYMQGRSELQNDSVMNFVVAKHLARPQ